MSLNKHNFFFSKSQCCVDCNLVLQLRTNLTTGVLTRGASSVLTTIFAELFAMTVGNCKRSIIAQKDLGTKE
jgi:hypothetical protein